MGTSVGTRPLIYRRIRATYHVRGEKRELHAAVRIQNTECELVSVVLCCLAVSV